MAELVLQSPLLRPLRLLARGWKSYTAGRIGKTERGDVNRLLTHLAGTGQLNGMDGATPRITSTLKTNSGVTIIFVSGRESGEIQAVLKLPETPDAEQSTARHRQVIGSLRAKPELAPFCRLIPETTGWGEFSRRTYHVETALPGKVASHPQNQLDTAAVKCAAVHALLPLQLHTLRRVVVDEPTYMRLAGENVAFLHRCAEHWPEAAGLCGKLDQMDAILRRNLLNRPLSLTWVHGDFWPGNVLIDQKSGTVNGILDWDRSSPSDLPLHDLFHLFVSTRTHEHRTKVGEEVVSYLLPAAFDASDRELFGGAIARLGLPCDPEFHQCASLLYWLRFASVNLSRYPAFQTSGPWLVKNVFLVLKQGLP